MSENLLIPKRLFVLWNINIGKVFHVFHDKVGTPNKETFLVGTRNRQQEFLERFIDAKCNQKIFFENSDQTTEIIRPFCISL